MLRSAVVLAHAGQPLAPHDLWGAWSVDPVLVVALVGGAWLYERGRSRGRSVDARRARSFAGGLAALAVALLSPLEALSHALASAHMVQHLLLLLVAAPLLAHSAPGSTVLRGSPAPVRRAAGRVRRRFPWAARTLRWLRHPATAWSLHVGTLWAWHAALLYDAALAHAPVHALEHATFVATGVLFWSVVLSSRSGARVSPGAGVLLVFTMALQSVFLSLLLTFAGDHWYAGYAHTTQAWGLEPLADQQLAGVLMWVPAGLLHLVVALALLVTWIHSTEQEAAGPPAAGAGATAAPR